MLAKQAWRLVTGAQGGVVEHSRAERHDTSTEGPVCSSHKEEEEAPTATSVKTVSCARLNEHKSKVNQNAIVSH